MGRGQIFIQDVSVSLAISIITILSLMAFINFNNAQFEKAVRSTHMQAVMDRVIDKLFVAGEYEFNTAKPFVVNDGFIGFVRSLNNEDSYERFREEMALSRESVAYDVVLDVMCEDGTHVTGGKKGETVLKKSILVLISGKVCSVDVFAGIR
ncbi:MAG: hypothetical protein QW500_02445 [Candidatus Micrarchaeia archaeon]